MVSSLLFLPYYFLGFYLAILFWLIFIFCIVDVQCSRVKMLKKKLLCSLTHNVCIDFLFPKLSIFFYSHVY